MGETEPPPTVHPRGQPISGSERNISLPWNRGRFDGAFRPRSGRNLWRRPRRDPREGIPPRKQEILALVNPQNDFQEFFARFSRLEVDENAVKMKAGQS